MATLQTLLKRLPKEYHDRVRNFKREDDLIDDCKYMLYYTDAYTDGECYGSCFPVKSVSEAICFIKESLHK